MMYEKPEVEVVKFDNAGFMTESIIHYASASDYLRSILGDSWNGNINASFSCSGFGNGEKYYTTPDGYTFEHKGGSDNWKLCKKYS